MNRRKKNGTSKHTVKAVEKKVTKLSKQLKPEIKYDTTAVALAIPAGTSFVTVGDIARGAGTNDRIGAKCKIIGIEWNWYMFNTAPVPPAFNTAPFVVRILIVCDKRSNQQAFNPANVFDADINVPGQPFYFTTARNREYLNRYSVIYDKTFTVGPEIQQGGLNNSTSDNNLNYKYRRFRKKQNQLAVYTESSVNGTPPETIQGHYYIGFHCTLPPVTVPATPTPNFNGIFRLLFTDV